MSDFVRVHFPVHEPDQHIIVERLALDDIERDVAYEALCVVVSSYKKQFEGPTTVANLPEGTFEAHFQPDDQEGVARYLQRMSDSMTKQGSTYWLARAGETMHDAYRGPLAGLIKVSPSRATLFQKLKLQAPNLYINDIVVAAENQSEGVGSDLFYAVTRFGGYREDAVVALDGYVANPRVNAWFKKLGFAEKPNLSVAPLELPHDQQLEEVRFETGEAALRGVSVALEQAYPRLLQSRPVRNSNPLFGQA